MDEGISIPFSLSQPVEEKGSFCDVQDMQIWSFSFPFAQDRKYVIERFSVFHARFVCLYGFLSDISGEATSWCEEEVKRSVRKGSWAFRITPTNSPRHFTILLWAYLSRI